ncbi:hypothetical protein QVM45_30635, partial [Pseudomonas aeruginosa]
DLALIKSELDEAEALLDSLDRQRQQLIEQCGQLKIQFEQAASATRKAYRGAEKGLSDTQRELALAHFPTLSAADLGDIVELERKHTHELQGQLKALGEKLGDQKSELAKRMSDALKVDTGALSEVGRELVDV